MNFAIVKEITQDLSNVLTILNRVHDHVNGELSKRDYGKGLSMFIVGVNCMNPKMLRPSRDFETGLILHKKYTKSKKLLELVIKLNYGDIYKAASDEEVVTIFSNGLLKSYSEVESLDIKDFAIGKFYNDIKELLQDFSWLKEPHQEIFFNYQQPKKERTEFSPSEKMPIDTFWELIEKARFDSQNNMYRQIEIITERLNKKDEKEIIGFECTLRELLIRAYHYNVMAVQKIVEGSVSDDSFLYFRCKLILYGRITFENAINNPNYIFERIDPNVSGELLLSVADTAFKIKFGNETQKTLPREYASNVIDYDFGDYDVQGKDWEEADIPKRYSKLWKAYK